MSEEEIKKCPECGGTNIIQDAETGELVCDDCGLIIDSHTTHNKGLSKMMEWKNEDSYGKPIPTRSMAQPYKLEKWQQRIITENEYEGNLSSELSELDKVALAMETQTGIRDAAAMVYRRAVEKNLIKGKNTKSSISTAIYIAYRQCGVPRSLDEVALYTNTNRNDIKNTYDMWEKELQLGLLPTSPTDFIWRICNNLNLSENVRDISFEILNDFGGNILSQLEDPVDVTCAVIYIACLNSGRKITLEELSNATPGVTEEMIRVQYRQIVDELNLDIKEKID